MCLKGQWLDKRIFSFQNLYRNFVQDSRSNVRNIRKNSFSWCYKCWKSQTPIIALGPAGTSNWVWQGSIQWKLRWPCNPSSTRIGVFSDSKWGSKLMKTPTSTTTILCTWPPISIFTWHQEQIMPLHWHCKKRWCESRVLHRTGARLTEAVPFSLEAEKMWRKEHLPQHSRRLSRLPFPWDTKTL